MTFYNNTLQLVIGILSGDEYSIFARWENVTIPRGAKITAAYVSFYCDTKSGTTPAATIYFEKAQNPTAPTGVNFIERPKTTASVSWTPPTTSGWNSSPSLVSIISELVAEYDYSNGSAMQLFWIPTGSLIGEVRYLAYDYNTLAYAPRLHIEYTMPSTVYGTTYRVSTGNHDGYQETLCGGDKHFYKSANELVLARDASGDTGAIFARWEDITIPRGAIITDARVSLYSYSLSGDRVLFGFVYFEKAQNPTVPTSPDLLTRSRTTAFSVWRVPFDPGTRNITPSLISIISELVAAYDYSSGGAMQMILMPPSTTVDSVEFRSYENGELYIPELYIEYTMPAVGLVGPGLCGSKTLGSGLVV